MADVDRLLKKQPSYTAIYIRGERVPKPEVLICFLRAFGWNERKLKAARLLDWYGDNGPVT